MFTFQPWSLEELIKREKVFDGLITRGVKMALRPLAMNVDGLLTAAMAELSISDLASTMLGPTVSMDSAGAVSVSWDNFVQSDLAPFLVDTFMEGAQKAHAVLPDDAPLLPESIAQDYLAASMPNLSNIGDLVWMSIQFELEAGVAAGEDMRQLAGRVRAASEMTAARAMTIARTEVHRAAEAGSLEQLRAAGLTNFECRKRWLSVEDERTRLGHVIADGQEVGLNELFEVAGEYLQYPGDPMGRADNVINCRCTMSYRFQDGPVIDVSSGAPSQVMYTFGDWTAEDELEHPRDNRGRFRKKNEGVAPKISQPVLDPIPPYVTPAIPLRDILPLVNRDTDNPPELPFDNARQLRQIFTSEFRNGFSTKVTELAWAKGDARFRVEGKIYNKKDKEVGMFTRIFKIKSNGKFVVDHEYLLLDEDVQGTGFANEFNRRAIAGYKRMGVDQVALQADIDIGGYAWARAGYDWAPDDTASLAEMLEYRLQPARTVLKEAPPSRTQKQIDDGFYPISSNLWKIPEERREEQAALAQKLWLDVGGTVDMDTPDDELADIIEMWPTPYELSQLGRWEGAGKDDMWIGKAIMLGSNWYGVRDLDDADA